MFICTDIENKYVMYPITPPQILPAQGKQLLQASQGKSATVGRHEFYSLNRQRACP